MKSVSLKDKKFLSTSYLKFETSIRNENGASSRDGIERKRRKFSFQNHCLSNFDDLQGLRENIYQANLSCYIL